MKVSLTIGRTINLGSYESLRVEVGAEVEMPQVPASTTKAVDSMHIELDKALKSVIEEEKTIKR